MLNNSQRRVALEIEGNAIVSASPGTGKTKTLVARAQKKLTTLPKYKKLALITYTNAAADEISERLNADSSEAFIGTIHRFCLEFILRPFGWIYGWHKPKVISYDDLRFFIQENENIDFGKSPLDELNKIKRKKCGNIDDAINWSCATDLYEVADLYYSFLETKKAIDFNEILYRSYKLITENPFISNSLANKFYEISIDEFQDTNVYQYEIFKSICLHGTCTFFIVGDEKQKIYTFAGAINDAFKKASIDFSSEIHILDTTYRSTNNIIKAYSSLFPDHPALFNESEYKDLNFNILTSKTNKDNNNSQIEAYINGLQKSNCNLSDIAILTYSWNDAYAISKALRKKFHVVGLGALPHRSSHASSFSIIKCLSKFIMSSNIRQLRTIKRNIEFHLLENNISLSDKEQAYALNLLISRIKKLDLEISLIQGLEIIKGILDDIFKIEHSDLTEIIAQINDDEANHWTLDKYIKTIAGYDGITVNTIHQAKGLEYKAVILNNVSENKIPYQEYLGQQDREYIYAQLTPENEEAGRTLFYVGISRAKAVLCITHNWKPSMFLPAVIASQSD